MAAQPTEDNQVSEFVKQLDKINALYLFSGATFTEKVDDILMHTSMPMEFPRNFSRTRAGLNQIFLERGVSFTQCSESILLLCPHPPSRKAEALKLMQGISAAVGQRSLQTERQESRGR